MHLIRMPKEVKIVRGTSSSVEEKPSFLLMQNILPSESRYSYSVK